MRVQMVPHLTGFKRDESGIRRVVEAYFRYLPDYGVELVDPQEQDFDLLAAHAGATSGTVDIAHTHGLYWTGDYIAPAWEYDINRNVIDSVRHARYVTVPSAWVAETFQRDMHFTPLVVPHGIEWQDWQSDEEPSDYVLWNKNRADGICDPSPVTELARHYPDVNFISTFATAGAPHNVRATGLLKHFQMKQIVQRAGVYLSTTKETFGIGILEAMASGVPVLAFDQGGARELIQHTVNGYLAPAGDMEGLIEGLTYCMKHRRVLGNNGRQLAKQWTWQQACEIVAGIYHQAMQREKPTVSIVIPCYNKAASVARTIETACDQDYPFVTEVIVVDDGSTDDSAKAIEPWLHTPCNVKYIRQDNRGVAHARNAGIAQASGKYIVALDADDWIDKSFVSACVDALEEDRSLGIAYTGLTWHKPDGSSGLSEWPGEFDFQAQLQRRNQIPTCCVFRREVWARLGGYRQRYAPKGAGAEDAEFWLRAGAAGWGAKKVTDAGLFHYAWLSGQASGNPDYKEVDWLVWHPWAGKNGTDTHPFASLARPQQWSHPVRQYDEPLVSVVIPVGPGHEKELLNALDSLEAQTLPQWEVIVVWDTSDREQVEYYRTAFPFVRWHITEGKRGAGFARNRGAELARAPFLVFLDADDWLYPAALKRMLDTWQHEQRIIYTDYVGKAYISDPEFLKKADAEGRLRAELADGEVVLGHAAFEFDCEQALRQPERPPYIWCNVTALIPRAWHIEIGGFDESLPSWEDVDYHWRMVRAGYCYHHLPEELLVYRFYTGGRRDAGFEMHGQLIEYLRKKYRKENHMGCSSCGQRNKAHQTQSMLNTVETVTQATTNGNSVMLPLAIGGMTKINDSDLVRAEYTSRNRGSHRVIGPVSRIDYGYRSGGDIFLIHRDDLKSGWFREVYEPKAITAPAVKQEVKEPEPLVAEPVKAATPVKAPTPVKPARRVRK